MRRALFVLSLFALGTGAFSVPEALVVRVRGGASCRTSEGTQPLRTAQRLAMGARVETAKDGEVRLLLYRDNSIWLIPSDARVVLEKTGLRGLSGPAPTRMGYRKGRAQSVLRRNRKDVNLGGVVVRSGPDGDLEVAPVGALRPGAASLRWSVPEGYDTARVRVLDGRRPVFEQLELAPSVRELALPGGSLKAGKVYTWTFLAFRSGEPVARASVPIWVLSGAEERAVAELEREYAAAAREGDVEACVILADAYEHLGLWAEAAEMYRLALKHREDDPGLKLSLEQVCRRLRLSG